MPGGFFPATEPDAPVAPVLDRLRPAVAAEPALQPRGCAAQGAAVHAELRTRPLPDGGLGLQRFYWSRQQPDAAAAYGFSAATLFGDGTTPDLTLHEFPSDPAMPWLDARTGPLRAGGRPEEVEVLRYIPLRRLTFRLYDGPGLPPRVIAKVKGTSGLSRAATAVLAVHLAATKARKRGADPPRVPQLLRLEPPRHVLHLEELPGEPLSVAARGDLGAAMDRLGATHRSLQELEVRGLATRRTMADWLDDAALAADRVTAHVPSVALRTQEVLAALRRTVPDEARPVFCQGDFLPGQVLCDPNGWSVVDFDDSRYADPLSDVAAMYLGLPRELRLGPDEAATAQRTYLEAYATASGEPFDEPRWRWFLTLLQLVELGKRLTKGRVAPDEPHEVLDGLPGTRRLTVP
jgi:aminoglycoside phosphotransferase